MTLCQFFLPIVDVLAENFKVSLAPLNSRYDGEKLSTKKKDSLPQLISWLHFNNNAPF